MDLARIGQGLGESTCFGASEGKEGKEPWDEAWRVKDATTPHLLRNIPA